MVANFSFADVRDRLQQMSPREQLLGVLVVGAALYFLADSLVFSPQSMRQLELESSQKMLQSQMVALSAQMSVVERTRADELERQEREYRQLKQQVAQLDSVAGSVTSEAPRLGKLVSDVLGAAPARVRAVGIKTVPVKTLFSAQRPAASTGKAQAPASPVVYKHGVDIELRGNYLDLLGYLNKLEDAHPKLFWSSTVLSAGAYPENTLRASVFMLSTQSNP